MKSYLLKVNNISANVTNDGAGTFSVPLPYNLQNKGGCYITCVAGTMGVDIQTPFATYMEIGVKTNLPCEGMSLVESVAGTGTSFSQLFNVDLTTSAQTGVTTLFHCFNMQHHPIRFYCSGLPDRISFNRYLDALTTESIIASTTGYISFVLMIEFDEPTVFNKSMLKNSSYK